MQSNNFEVYFTIGIAVVNPSQRVLEPKATKVIDVLFESTGEKTVGGGKIELFSGKVKWEVNLTDPISYFT